VKRLYLLAVAEPIAAVLNVGANLVGAAADHGATAAAELAETLRWIACATRAAP
jgi:hypothetical protein